MKLEKLIDTLKASPRVRGIFTTGTTATSLSPSSDIDLVVVLDRNSEDIKSVYTMAENHFADIFFFDTDFVQKLGDKKEILSNAFEGMFLEWLSKGKVEYDYENLLANLKQEIKSKPPMQKVPDAEKKDFWIKINYNFIANSRYYDSNDTLYQEALEMRLLYSTMELITAYFSFRDIPWRGEKTAIKYLEKNDPDFRSLFHRYSASQNIDDRMSCYRQLFEKTLHGEYQKWSDDFVIPISWKEGYKPKLEKWWESVSKNE